MFGVMQHLKVVVCENSSEAVEKGYVYSHSKGFKAIEIETVVVVRKGTEGGNSTVDLILVDEAGNKFVCMVTGALLKSIPT